MEKHGTTHRLQRRSVPEFGMGGLGALAAERAGTFGCPMSSYA